MAIEKFNETTEVAKQTKNEFKDIKPQSGMTFDRAIDIVKDRFEHATQKPQGLIDGLKERFTEYKDKELGTLVKEYDNELRKYSEFEDTLPEKALELKDLHKIPAEKLKELRAEFNSHKDELKKQWESIHGRPWPKYKEDVYIINSRGEKVLIRKAGEDYDVHHVKPLGLGGTNSSENITPMSADVHSCRQGIHGPDSAYSKIDKLLGGRQ